MRSCFWWCFLLSVVVVVDGQDMREDCVSCSDIFKKCELSCLLPSSRDDETDMSECLSTCKRERSRCKETSAATECLSCVEACANTYDVEMQDCLQSVDPKTTMTFGKELDACSISASSRMDACSETCYGGDGYYGWSPEAEEGLEAPAKFTIDAYLPEQAENKNGVAFDEKLQLSGPTLIRTWSSSSSSSSSYLRVSAAVGVAMIVVGCALERLAFKR